MSVITNNNLKIDELKSVRFEGQEYSGLKLDESTKAAVKDLASVFFKKFFINFAIPFASSDIWESVNQLGEAKAPIDFAVKLLGYRNLNEQAINEVVHQLNTSLFAKVLCLGAAFNASEDLMPILSSSMLTKKHLKEASTIANLMHSTETLHLLRSLPHFSESSFQPDYSKRSVNYLDLAILPHQVEGIEELDLYVECALKILKKANFHQLYKLENFKK